MTREEILEEIVLVKQRLMNESKTAQEEQRLTIALIALYDSLVKIDNELLAA